MKQNPSADTIAHVEDFEQAVQETTIFHSDKVKELSEAENFVFPEQQCIDFAEIDLPLANPNPCEQEYVEAESYNYDEESANEIL